jgi:hypothetical protein
LPPEVRIIQTGQKCFVQLCGYSSTPLKSGLTIFVKGYPATIAAHVVEREMDVGALRTTFGNNRPVSEETKDQLAGEQERFFASLPCSASSVSTKSNNGLWGAMLPLRSTRRFEMTFSHFSHTTRADILS